MIKIYFDWNVLSQIRNGKHNELKDIIWDNEDLFIPFSTSHISDIFSSYNETQKQNDLINEDLEFISHLTKDKCLMNTGTEVLLDFYSPKDLFEQKIQEKDTFTDLSLDGLMKIFEEGEEVAPIASALLNMIKALPVNELFQKAFENPESSTIMEKMFPGLKEEPTMEGFFKSFSKMNANFNESDEYKDFRQMLQSGFGINRDKIFDSKEPYKTIDAVHEKLNINPLEHFDDSKYAPQWFNKITNEYLLLDMHGYQEDKVNIKKGRKETFKNTTEDSFHAAFASTCNIYVINDNKSYKKTRVIYDRLDVNTLVMKPNEFVEHYKNYLKLDSPLSNISLPFEFIQTDHFVESEKEGNIFRTYVFYQFLYNFFNKITLVKRADGGNPLLVLQQHEPSNNTVYSIEVEHLVKTINSLFGSDIENLGEVKLEELQQEIWVGRKWKLDGLILRLIRSNNEFQLYYDLNSDRKKEEES
ncbi:MAG: hypothetical protein JJE55_15590 [Flavobacteriaceae bacterium]|nr:hypothetical protein [Flavobacteriaceae bacterium]